MKFAGIDPGAHGAIAIIDSDTIKIFDYKTLPEIAYFISENRPVFAYLEKVSARPGQGVSSMFKFGTNFGQWQGILAALSIPYELITPQRWQKGISYQTDGATKEERSINAALRLFPDAAHLIRGPLGNRNKQIQSGRADALILAHCARRDYK